MSGPITVDDGSTVLKDPTEYRVMTFDWDDRSLATSVTISSSSWTITGESGDTTTTPLSSDNTSVLTGSRKTQIRLSAGALGSTWRVSNTITTNESPANIKTRSVWVRVENL
jgi:hypothetical protein